MKDKSEADETQAVIDVADAFLDGESNFPAERLNIMLLLEILKSLRVIENSL